MCQIKMRGYIGLIHPQRQREQSARIILIYRETEVAESLQSTYLLQLTCSTLMSASRQQV